MSEPSNKEIASEVIAKTPIIYVLAPDETIEINLVFFNCCRKIYFIYSGFQESDLNKKIRILLSFQTASWLYSCSQFQYLDTCESQGQDKENFLWQ